MTPDIPQGSDPRRHLPSQDEYKNLHAESRDLVPEARPEPKGMARSSNAWMRYSALGFQMVAAMLIPLGIGIWLDQDITESPFGTAAGAILGVAASMYAAIAPVLRDASRDKARKAK